MTTLQRGEEALLCRAKAVDWARLKICFAATALCMLLAHGFAWFNLFPSHDGTIVVFVADVVMLQLGRWVELPYLRLLRGLVEWRVYCFLDFIGYVSCQQLAATGAQGHGGGVRSVQHSHQRNAAVCDLLR